MAKQVCYTLWLTQPRTRIQTAYHGRQRLCSFSPKMSARITRCDFSYFCAIAAPEAPRDRFRTVCDWGNWVSYGRCRSMFTRHLIKLDSPMTGFPL